MKIHVAAVEALRKKDWRDKTEFTIKIDGFLSLTPPPLDSNAFFFQVFSKISPCDDPTQGSGAVFVFLYG